MSTKRRMPQRRNSLALTEAERARRRPIWQERKHQNRLKEKQVISAWADKDRVPKYKRAAKKLGLTVAGMILMVMDERTDEVLNGK